MRYLIFYPGGCIVVAKIYHGDYRIVARIYHFFMGSNIICRYDICLIILGDYHIQTGRLQ